MKQFILITLILLLQFPGFANSGLSAEDEKQKIEAELKIYPNPVKNNQVTLSFQTKEISEVRLVNITGKEVVKQEYVFPLQKTVLTLNEVPNGLYIIQIKTSDQQLISKKLMISRD
ncbi:MAG TPA: T9SS type A sorting domain-containing protein [Draconibacterium sp.]|nr:T9SS type A sorting domain-containing protein [Draconibacterium sp.]